MIVDDPARALPVVERLAALGVRLSIDDFGTGYRSLEYLKVLPVAEMKIDRAFVAGMADDVRDAAIVRHSIELGRSLGLRVVAEGVESREAHERLAAMGCDHGQGFLYSRAGPGRGVRGVRRARRGAAGAAPGAGAGRQPRDARLAARRLREALGRRDRPPASLPPQGASLRSSESHLQAVPGSVPR